MVNQVSCNQVATFGTINFAQTSEESTFSTPQYPISKSLWENLWRKSSQITLALSIYMMLEPMLGETELMIQPRTIMFHHVHKINYGESGSGTGIVPSINPIMC